MDDLTQEARNLDEKLASQIGDDVSVIFSHEYLFKEARRVTAALLARLEAAEATLADWQASQKYRYIGRDGKPVLARELEDRAEAAEAKAARMEEAAGQARLLIDTGFSEFGETVNYNPSVTAKVLALLDAALQGEG